MNELTDEQRAQAQLDAAAIAARNEFYGADRGPEATSEWRWVVLAALNAISPDQLGNLVNTWLAVEAHVLAAHECPSTDRRALGYYRHPRMDGQAECPECGYPMHEHGWLDCGGDGIVVCPSQHGPFGGQSVTDHARNHTCPTVPVWRPTTADEIQPGWEIRSRDEENVEATWGIAHHQDPAGDWISEEGAVLTYDVVGWTCETTAPMPKPNPRIQIVRDWHNDLWGSPEDGDILELLTRINALKEGEQS